MDYFLYTFYIDLFMQIMQVHGIILKYHHNNCWLDIYGDLKVGSRDYPEISSSNNAQ